MVSLNTQYSSMNYSSNTLNTKKNENHGQKDKPKSDEDDFVQKHFGKMLTKE